MENPYLPPQSEIAPPPPLDAAPEYANFGLRLGGFLLDMIILMVITVPISIAIYGVDSLTNDKIVQGPIDFAMSYVLPIFYYVGFWYKKGATPGKLIVKIKIVSEHGGQLSLGQCIGRYFATILSSIALLLGYLWVIWDPKKQAWHDKLAGTIVIRS